MEVLYKCMSILVSRNSTLLTMEKINNNSLPLCLSVVLENGLLSLSPKLERKPPVIFRLKFTRRVEVFIHTPFLSSDSIKTAIDI